MGIIVLAAFLMVPLAIIALWTFGWGALFGWFHRIADGNHWVFLALILVLFGMMALGVQIYIRWD